MSKGTLWGAGIVILLGSVGAAVLFGQYGSKFLNPESGWSDFLAVYGAIGSLVTILAFLLAITQVNQAAAEARDAATAADAASRAAQAAAKMMKDQYLRHVVTQAAGIEKEICTHLGHRDWGKAAFRAGDLADLLMQLTHQSDNAWEDFANRTRSAQHSLQQVRPGALKPKVVDVWNALSAEMRARFAPYLGPFDPPRVSEEQQ
jgi:hypothetical protein